MSDALSPAALAQIQALERLRGNVPRPPLTPLDQRVLWIVGAHLAFLPWALGTQHAWSQLVSLGLAVAGLLAVLLTGEEMGRTAGRRLLRLPFFWVGLAWLAYGVAGACNPAQRLVVQGKLWAVQPLQPVAGLPIGVDVPFELGGPWRVIVVHASVWLVACTLWVGCLRRKVALGLVLVAALNGGLVALMGLAQRLGGMPFLFGLPAPRPGSQYATFIYKNHAGAYLLVGLTAAVALAGWYYLRAERRSAKSSPAGLFVILGLGIAGAVLLSRARGATLTMMVLLGLWLVLFAFWEWRRATRQPWIAALMLAAFGYFVFNGLEAVDAGGAWERIEHGLSGHDASFEARKVASAATAELAAAHRLWGTGAGSFALVFPAFQTKYPALMGPAGSRPFWEYAHNDVLQTLAEYGVVGCLILVAGVLCVFVPLLRQRAYRHPVGAGVVSGVAALVVYSQWDFPLQCPAILLTAVALTVLAVRWTQFEGNWSAGPVPPPQG